jgi:LCP family protein required for cell wall assembly
MEKRRKSLKRLIIVLSIVLAILLLAAAAIYFVTDSFLSNIEQLGTHPTLSQEQLESEFVDDDLSETDPLSDQAETIASGDEVINILLVGQDRRGGNAPQRTDAMIMVTINKPKKTLTMTSFMRDLWVYIPDHYNQRLNVPYMLGGFPVLNATLDYNFGIKADYNVEIDFSGFMKAIDAVGGVEIELTAAEARYLNKWGNWDVESNQHWNLKEGVTCLTGSQALAYSRIRDIGTDFGRTNRQRTVLTSLIDKVKTSDVTELYALAKEIVPLLRTDMETDQIFDLIVDMLPMLSDMQIVSQRIPIDGEYTFANKNGASVIVLTPDQLERNIKLITDTVSE